MGDCEDLYLCVDILKYEPALILVSSQVMLNFVTPLNGWVENEAQVCFHYEINEHIATWFA